MVSRILSSAACNPERHNHSDRRRITFNRSQNQGSLVAAVRNAGAGLDVIFERGDLIAGLFASYTP